MNEQNRLIQIIKEIAEGNYSNDIMPFTRPECPEHIREIAEAIGMMMVKLEARELRLEQLNEALRENTLKTIASATKAMAARDTYTRGHGNRVAAYAVRLGRRMGLDNTALKEVETAGLLHDIGKIGFTDKVFNNQDITPDSEILAEIRQHPETGVEILKDLDFLGPVLEYIHSHHEHLNGQGYPRGLSEEEIPLGARIISVADCFDAITTDRAYQKGKSRDEGFQILKILGTAQLDADLVEAFINDVRENGMEESAL
ncbi:MAG: HD domain-containing protein [Proteobacteria bacterium]|nr:HD domain-containing protein [Pseudomonadota bacterium]